MTSAHLAKLNPEQRRAVRSVITVEVTRVGDSCGFVVPRMDYVGERDQLYRYAGNRIRKLGSEAVAEYVSENNAHSLDGLTGLDPLVSTYGRGASAGRKL